MNVHITVNLPDREFEAEYQDVASFAGVECILNSIKADHPDMESVVIVVTL